jgi:hypothetical protein
VLSALALTAAQAAPIKPWTLVYSNDVLGELEPCGCRSNPMGGLARKWNWLKGLSDSAPLQIDAGDLLFETSPVPEPLRQQTLLQAKELLKGYDLLGHSLVVPGEKDFALGLDSFLEIIRGRKTRFIAANLFRQDKQGRRGKPLLQPSAKFRRDGLRIAVLGLVGDELPWPKGLMATSAEKAAKDWIPRLRREADLVIAVTHQGFEADRALAEKVPGIDLIIGAHTQSFLQNPIQVGSTWIVQSSYRNQHPGTIRLSKNLKTEDFALTGLDAGYDTHPPDSKASPRPPTPMDRHVAAFKARIAELNTLRDQALRRQILPASASARSFQTWPRCAECHLLQFDFWRKTPHAGAHHALVGKGQEKNKACIACHSVGFGEPKGFTEVSAVIDGIPHDQLDSFLEQMRAAPALKSEVRLTKDDSPQPLHLAIQRIRKSHVPVQCENCHRLGSDHPGDPSPKVAVESCVRCHTADQAPAWYDSKGALNREVAEQKLKAMSCPAGTATID